MISSPEQIAAWWVDEADFDLTPCSAAVLATVTATGRIEVPIAVVKAAAATRFAFYWVPPPAPVVRSERAVPTIRNSVPITFDLTPDGRGRW